MSSSLEEKLDKSSFFLVAELVREMYRRWRASLWASSGRTSSIMYLRRYQGQRSHYVSCNWGNIRSQGQRVSLSIMCFRKYRVMWYKVHSRSHGNMVVTGWVISKMICNFLNIIKRGYIKVHKIGCAKQHKSNSLAVHLKYPQL